MDSNKKKKIYGIISIIVVVILMLLITYFVFVEFRKFGRTPEEFRNFIQSFGWSGRIVGVGIQMLQIVVALIPGEAVEIGLGYAFGAFEGTILCYAGTILASTVVFLLTKKFGIKFVEIFTTRDKIDNMRLINTQSRLKKTVFLLFFIPGIPKDIITYFIGLTKMSLLEFLIISSIARIPSVVSSTIGGAYVGNGEYWKAVVIFAVTAVISLICILIYNKISKKRSERSKQ